MHRIQRVPTTEKRGRRHSSLITIVWFDADVVAHAAASSERFPAGEVRIDTYRGSGAGGQHRNKTDSCVRAVHLPTSTVVVATESRSQHENRRVALARLWGQVNALQEAVSASEVNAVRREVLGDGAGWRWVGWRDQVSTPTGRTASMRRVLQGRFDLLGIGRTG